MTDEEECGSAVSEASRETYRGWNIPTATTLKKYGGTVEDWVAVIDRQDGVCPVCTTVPKTGRGVIDHEHVRGWKDMAPEIRWLYVRGVTCWWCNSTHLGRGITAEKARNTAVYLEDYLLRRPTWGR